MKRTQLRTDEADAAFGKTDYRHPEGGRGRGGGDGSVPSSWHVERDLLRVEGQVRRTGGCRTPNGLRALDGENARLKRLLADTMLDNADLKDLMVTPAAGPKAARNAYREAAAHLQTTLGMNERRACAVVGAASPSTARRRSGSIARK